MNWHANRHPLTLKVARTMRETDRSSTDWWEGPMPVQAPRKHKPSVIPTHPPLAIWCVRKVARLCARVMRAVVALWSKT